MDYHFYGYRLQSEIPLSTLAAMDTDGAPEIVLRLGDVMSHVDHPLWTSPFLEINQDKNVLAKVGSLRFHISSGSEIVLRLPAAGDSSEVETHLSSLVAGALLHQRGDLALHASAVNIHGAAIALSGASGQGKSTLASVFALAGYPLISDDVCRVQFSGDRVMVFPGPPRIRLWPDMARAIGKNPDDLAVGRADHPKRLLTDLPRTTDAKPLCALIRLVVDPRLDKPMMERITGPASVMPMDDLLYRTRLGRRMGRAVPLFRNLMQLGSMVPVFRLKRPDGPPDLQRLIDLVLSALQVGA